MSNSVKVALSWMSFVVLTIGCFSAAVAQELPLAVTASGQPLEIIEGVHKFGEPYTKQQMRYASTGRLVSDIILDDGWGMTPIPIKAGTPVFGVVVVRKYRQSGVTRTSTEPLWCGILDAPHKQLGNGPSFCSRQGSGSMRNRTVSDRAFNPPDWVQFTKIEEGGTYYHPTDLGIGPKIKGLFDVRSEPIDFGKQIWIGTAVVSWGERFFLTSQLHGEGESSNRGELSIKQILPTGSFLHRLGGEIVELEKVDAQHYRATIVSNRTDLPPPITPLLNKPVSPAP